MKTAMQELIEVLKEKMDSLPNDSRFLKHRSGLRSAITSANSLLVKEQQQIDTAYQLGQNWGIAQMTHEISKHNI